MLKEKYIPHLAAFAMLFMVVLVVIGTVFNLTSGDEKQDVTTIQQPEYMSKIFDQNQILQINIQIDESNWEELKENAAAEEYYPADITINGETYRNIGIRAKGNSSLTMVANDDTTDRYSFKIKVDEYQDQNIYGLQKFVLNNMIGDATYMKEYISYDMCKEMGIATPGYAFANITLNGEPWGVYLAVESLEESFIERNFGDLDGNLYKVESMGGMGGGNKAGGNPPQMPEGTQGGNNTDMPQMPEGTQGGNNTDMPQMPEGTQGGNNTDMPQMPEGTQGGNNTDMPQMPEGTQGGNNTDMPQMPEGTQGGNNTDMPQMPEGTQGGNNTDMPQMPEGTQGGNNTDMPQMPEGTQGGNNTDMPQMPEGTQGGNNTDMPQMPEGTQGGNNTDMPQMPNDGQDGNNKGQMKGPGGMGGMGSSGGANLVYSDDEISSYSSIFNYTVFKKTTENDYKTLIGILKNLNEGTNLEESIDVEEVLKYFAVNTFLVNLDSYAGNMKHNFYLYEEDGKLQILPWDYNLAFGAFEMSDASKVINFPIDAPVTDSMENSPLISKLLEVDAYKEMYHSYLQELVDKYITSGKYEETINKLDTLIGDYVKNDATAFYTYDEYQSGIKELKQYGIDRTTSVKAQISGEQPSTEYGTIETTMNLMAMGQQNGGKGGPGGDKMADKGADQSAPMSQGNQGADNVQSNEPEQQGGGMQNMPNVDMETMQEIMSIIGEVSSVSELTEEQKTQITALGVDESALESLFKIKKMFENMGGGHNGTPGQATQTQMSDQDKIMAVVCGILLVGGLIFALTFKRKRY